MPYILAAFGFAVLIILHEFGHFAAAKATGMRVERFALFFPPLILKTKRGETEYGIGAIPLGGYVKITGMNPEEEIPPEAQGRGYYQQAVWKRVVVILAGPFMNLLIAFFLLFGLAFGFEDPSNEVAGISSAPAKGALKVGDRVISVDGVRGDQTTIRRQIARHRCPGQQTPGCQAAMPAVLVVERNGKPVTIRVRPRYSPANKQVLVGFQYGSKPINPGVPRAATLALGVMWDVTKGTLRVFVHIFEKKERKQISGVVGGYEVTRQSFARSIRQALVILAVVSLSLALINLFPFLPLDGGHVFWSVAEKLRGKPIPYRVIEQASVIGVMLVAFLFIVGFTNDFNRLTGGGFNNR
jgi:regulator of sigma E protease